MSLEGLPDGERPGRIILGESALQSPTGGGRPAALTRNPHSTGGSHVIQIVGGRVVRTIAPMAGGGAVPGPRPAKPGGMRVCNHSAGMDIALRARRPVCTRMVDGREQIVYRTQDMDEGRLYAVEWNGEHYALRKSGGSVEIFKFRPDGGDDEDGVEVGPAKGAHEKRGHVPATTRPC